MAQAIEFFRRHRGTAPGGPWCGVFFFDCYPAHRDLHSFPTRRSSDLDAAAFRTGVVNYTGGEAPEQLRSDRKSTRLNSSHTVISYAVFCLKKKMAQMNQNGVSDIVWPPDTETKWSYLLMQTGS